MTFTSIVRRTMSINQGRLLTAIRAALRGPEERGVRFANYSFNVKPARVNRWENEIVVQGDAGGYISRRRRARPNDRIYYRAEIRDGAVQRVGVLIDRGGVRAIHRPISDTFESLTTIPLPRVILQLTGVQRTQGLTLNDTAVRHAESLIDGTWEGEARFLIAQIAVHAH
jgi:hypothetical protein